MSDLPFRSAKQLVAALRARKVSSQELLELYLERTKRFNPQVNAIVWKDEEGARKRARAADAALRRRRGSAAPGALHGLPMTVKEAYDVAGMPTTWGFPDLKDHRAQRNSVVVQRFVDAGAIVFGKTNVPAGLADFQSYNALYGTTNNPWDLARTPGGSSGGSAAALAAGLTGLEAGSDIGSSIRNPAHYCGVYGHKPTWGIVSALGHAIHGWTSHGDIAVVGPLGRSADDLALALGVMGGPDPADGIGWKLSLPPARKKALREFNVGLMLSDPVGPVDQEVAAQLERLGQFLRKRRVRVDERARPDIDSVESHRMFLPLLNAALSVGIPAEEFERMKEVARSAAPGDTSSKVRLARGATLPHRDWLFLDDARNKLRGKWAAFFEKYDLLLCPAMSTAAFPHDHEGQIFDRFVSVDGRKVPMTAQLFWAGYSGVVFLPSTVAPIGRTPAGLPIGVQIIGPQYGDRTCIAFAQLLEREYYGFVPPPGFD